MLREVACSPAGFVLERLPSGPGSVHVSTKSKNFDAQLGARVLETEVQIQILATESDAKRPGARLTHVVTPLMRLQNPEYTKVLLVTLAETTPVSEAARLQDDLRRAQIEPYAWVINSSLAAASSADPCLKQRIAGELEQIEIVRARHAQRIAIVPWMTEEPVGPERLLGLARRGDPNSREGVTEQARSPEG
jgi:anion-transporting  ArsA/GET3 family ATPase